jgi:light-regulated signal transduction histidine kinase (bacteriophytochrome)
MTRRLLDKTDFLKYVFDTIPSFMFVVDEDVRILHLNSAALTLLGGDLNQALFKRGGEALRCIHSSETPNGCGHALSCKNCVIRNSVNEAFKGKRIHREESILELVRDGMSCDINVRITTNPLKYEGNDFVLLLVEDITDLKRSEEQLKQHAARLEDTNRELDAFSYSVSHDLKAPLRSIYGFSDLLLQDFGSRLDDEVKGFLQRIHSSGLRMTQLVDDMLILSRITKEELHHEDVDLSALALTVEKEIMTNCPGRSIKFIIEPHMHASCDVRLTQIVLDNLFSNAVKFTSKKGEAKIEFGVTERDGKPYFYVKDNGVGFDPTYAGKMFKPFQRLHSDSEFEGTGIGLAIVERVIRKHNGRICAEGESGKGATFYFTLQ